jgi:general secretion pathway protein J
MRINPAHASHKLRAGQRSRGLSLIELMVALAITALIAVASYKILDLSQQSSDANYRDSRRLLQLDRSFALIQSDLQQLTARPIRTYIQEIKPAFSASAQNHSEFAFTRFNWANPLNHHRSELQRLHYYFRDGTLYRRYPFQLDLVDEVLSTPTPLIDNVESIHIRYLYHPGPGQTSQWLDHWPPEQDYEQQLLLLPAAVDMRLNTVDLGQIRRVFLTQGGGL